MKTLTLALALCVLSATSPAAAPAPPQENAGVVILGHSWVKERIRQRPSASPLASQEELIKQSRLERQLAIARNTDRGMATKVEGEIIRQEDANAKARQTAPPEDGYRYSVKLRNDGGKTIKSIDWDYLFIDAETSREVARHQFTSDDTIKPGKSKEISVLYLIPPVRTVDARRLNKKGLAPYTQQVVIVRLQFSDGSVWQRP